MQWVLGDWGAVVALQANLNAQLLSKPKCAFAGKGEVEAVGSVNQTNQPTKAA